MGEVPDRIELGAGEQFVIELPGLGTAGYIWDHEVTGPPGVVDVQWTRGFAPGTAPPGAGVSAPEVATIQARGAGTVELRLYQHRRWEKAGQALQQHQLHVVVRPT